MVSSPALLKVMGEWVSQRTSFLPSTIVEWHEREVIIIICSLPSEVMDKWRMSRHQALEVEITNLLYLHTVRSSTCQNWPLQQVFAHSVTAIHISRCISTRDMSNVANVPAWKGQEPLEEIDSKWVFLSTIRVLSLACLGCVWQEPSMAGRDHISVNQRERELWLTRFKEERDCSSKCVICLGGVINRTNQIVCLWSWTNQIPCFGVTLYELQRLSRWKYFFL